MCHWYEISSVVNLRILLAYMAAKGLSLDLVPLGRPVCSEYSLESPVVSCGKQHSAMKGAIQLDHSGWPQTGSQMSSSDARPSNPTGVSTVPRGAWRSRDQRIG